MTRNVLMAATLLTAGLLASSASAKPKAYTVQYAFEVTQVFPGRTADRQGIEVGDIIVSVDGRPVRSGNDLSYLLRRSGKVATLQVIDVNTGRTNEILVYPDCGKIGVDGQQVPLGSIGSPPPPSGSSPYSGSPKKYPVPTLPGR